MEKPKLNPISAIALATAFLVVAVPLLVSGSTVIQDNGIGWTVDPINLWVENIYENTTFGISSWNIRDNTILSEDIGENTIVGLDILDNTILNADICDNTIDASDSLLDNSVTSTKIQDSTIASIDVLDNTIASADILDNTIDNTKILDNTIGGDKLTDNAADNRVISPLFIQSGVENAGALAASNGTDNFVENTITFDHTFGVTPVVIVTLENTNAFDFTEHDNVPVAVIHSVSTTGFTVDTFNPTDTELDILIHWIAMVPKQGSGV